MRCFFLFCILWLNKISTPTYQHINIIANIWVERWPVVWQAYKSVTKILYSLKKTNQILILSQPVVNFIRKKNARATTWELGIDSFQRHLIMHHLSLLQTLWLSGVRCLIVVLYQGTICNLGLRNRAKASYIELVETSRYSVGLWRLTIFLSQFTRSSKWKLPKWTA